MNCKDIDQFQHAFVDGELAPADMRAVAVHLASCPDCSTRIEQLTALRQTIKTASRFAPPPGLYEKIAGLDMAEPPVVVAMPRRWLPLKWGGMGASIAMAACLAFLMITRPNEQFLIQQELIGSHIRSLQADHLTDVISTDQHTVQPWFNGRLDIAPPVIDLAASGFALVGGRLDYIDQHTVAVLIYRHNAHVINLFIWPAPQGVLGTSTATVQQGYNMQRWQAGDLQFWAVSDVNPVKLAEFEKLYRARTQ